MKTARKTVRRNAVVTGKWHDRAHTLIAQLAENGAGQDTIRQIVGHVSQEVLSVRAGAKIDHVTPR